MNKQTNRFTLTHAVVQGMASTPCRMRCAGCSRVCIGWLSRRQMDAAKVSEGKARNCPITGVASSSWPKFSEACLYLLWHSKACRLWVLQVLVAWWACAWWLLSLLSAIYPTEMTARHIYIYTHTVYTWYDFLAKHRLTCLRPWSCCRGGFNLDKSGFTLSCTGKRQSVFQFEWSLGVSIYVSLYVCIFSGVVGVAAIHFKEIRGNRQSCTPRLIRLKRWMRCRHVGRLDGGSQRDGHKSSSCRVLMWIPVVLISFQCVAQCRSNAFPFSCDAQSEHCWSHSTTAANSGARLVLARQCSNCIKIASCICRRTPVDNLDILMQFCFFVTSCHTFGICWRQLTSFDSESKDFYTAFATSSIDAKTNCNGKCSIRLFRRIW